MSETDGFNVSFSSREVKKYGTPAKIVEIGKNTRKRIQESLQSDELTSQMFKAGDLSEIESYILSDIADMLCEGDFRIFEYISGKTAKEDSEPKLIYPIPVKVV